MLQKYGRSERSESRTLVLRLGSRASWFRLDTGPEHAKLMLPLLAQWEWQCGA
jgi:hypothetical protein